YTGAGYNPTQIAASAMASQQLQQQIWRVISEQSRINPPGNISTMVPAVSEMMDAGAAIEAAYSNTVPAIVLILLFGAIIFTGLLVGHSFGRAGRRHILTAVVFALLVTLVVSVILDLDRPRRGVIRENFGPLENLRVTMRSALPKAQQVGHWFCALVASARQELSFTGDLFMTNSRLFGFVIKEIKELLAPTLF